MEEWARLVSTVGFPIAVTAYLLYRMEKKLEALASAILSLSNAVLRERDKL